MKKQCSNCQHWIEDESQRGKGRLKFVKASERVGLCTLRKKRGDSSCGFGSGGLCGEFVEKKLEDDNVFEYKED